MSRPIREVSRTIATATRTKLATARQRIHEAVEHSPIRLAHPPARTTLATIGCLRVTGHPSDRDCHAICRRKWGSGARSQSILAAMLANYWGWCPGVLTAMRSAELKSVEPNGRDRPSVVAVSAFHPLVPLLGFDAEGGDGPGFETANADRFVRLFAITVGAVV